MDTSDQHAAALAIVHEEAGRTLSKDDFDLCMRIAKRALGAPSEHEKAMADAVIYGTGIMKDGQHVPFDQVRVHPDEPALLPCRVCGSTAAPTRTMSGHGEHWFTCTACREQTPRLKSALQCVLAWNARDTLTQAQRTVIYDAMYSVSEHADGIKAGCAVGDEWPDAEDKAYYDKQVNVLERLRSLLDAKERTPIYQIGANAGGGIAWWDVDKDRYEREKKAGFMKTGIVYREGK